MPQPTLHSARITLIPLSDRHLDHEVELDSDPAVMQFLGNGQARTREEVVGYHRRRLAGA